MPTNDCIGNYSGYKQIKLVRQVLWKIKGPPGWTDRWRWYSKAWKIFRYKADHPVSAPAVNNLGALWRYEMFLSQLGTFKLIDTCFENTAVPNAVATDVNSAAELFTN